MVKMSLNKQLKDLYRFWNGTSIVVTLLIEDGDIILVNARDKRFADLYDDRSVDEELPSKFMAKKSGDYVG
jgi:hypothetical protein